MNNTQKLTAQTEDQFEITDQGVFFLSGRAKTWICSPLHVLAITRDENNENWGRLLAFKDRDGKDHEWAMPIELIASSSTEVRRHLLSMGLDIYQPKRNQPDLLVLYLQSQNPDARIRSVSRVGWHGSNYVLPTGFFGPGAHGEEVALQSMASGNHTLKSRGTLEDWKSHVGIYLRGNTNLVFAASAAFVGPLLKITKEESGGFHFFGRSSIGKTTALYIAGSIWGGDEINGYKDSWRSTTNGLEALLASRCDGLLVLDEIDETDPKELGKAAYMMANQSGKTRSDRFGGIRKKNEWRVLFLSSGELTLSQYMNEAKKKVRAGQETRMIDLASEVSEKHGSFEEIHGFEDGSKFSESIKARCFQFYGSPIQEFLSKLAGGYSGTLTDLDRIKDKFQRSLGPDCSGQVRRVCNRFALVACAGELAIHFGVLPLEPGSAISASSRMFANWLEARGTTEAIEIKRAIEQVRDFFQRCGSSHFQTVEDRLIAEAKRAKADITIDTPTSGSRDRAGYRVVYTLNTVWYVFPQVFRDIICRGFDHRMVAKALIARKYLIADGGGHYTSPQHIKGLNNKRYVLINDFILEETFDQKNGEDLVIREESYDTFLVANGEVDDPEVPGKKSREASVDSKPADQSQPAPRTTEPSLQK